jgi:hypothetical protein
MAFGGGATAATALKTGAVLGAGLCLGGLLSGTGICSIYWLVGWLVGRLLG